MDSSEVQVAREKGTIWMRFSTLGPIGNASRRIWSQLFASSLSSSRTQAQVWMELLRPWETLRAFS
jgi:hypothetical protein